MLERCPPREELADYAAGLVDSVDCESIDLHLETCVDCQSELSICSSNDDTLVSLLRQGVDEVEYGQEPQLRERLQVLERSSSQHFIKPSRPSELGPYRFLKRLGRGGMGDVYLAEHLRLEMPVAIKLLSHRLASDSRATARFDREMKAVGKLSHPNIVRATDAGEYNGTPFLAMEFIDGSDVGQICREHGRLRICDACEIVRQAAVGIQHAHDHGLIHRDLKPSNLMLCKDGVVKVLDLGLARLKEHTANELTDELQILGTADYMAPEQANSDHKSELDPRVDIYSLGCTLYTLLAGRAPFGDEDHSTPLQKIIAHQQESPTPIGEIRAGLPASLISVIERAMAKSRKDRCDSSADFANALNAFVSGSELAKLQQEAAVRHAVVDTCPDDSTTGLPADTMASSGIASEPESIRRSTASPNRVLLVALATLVIAVLASLTMTFQSKNGSLVVQIDGDNIAAIPKGERLVIEDIENEVIYYLSIVEDSVKQDFAPGTYQIRVENEASGLELSTQEFRIKRKEETIVHAVIAKPTPSRVSTIESSSSQDQCQMVWAISKDATFDVLIDGQLRLVTNKDEVPQDDFQIFCVNFGKPVELTTGDWDQLRQLKELNHLEFSDLELTDELVTEFNQFPMLSFLALRYDQKEPSGLEKLQQLPRLTTLNIGGQLVADSHVALLKPLTGIGRLTVSGRQVTDAGLVHLSEMRQLQFVSLIFTKVNGTGLEHLQSLPKLDSLHLPYTQVDDRGAEFFAGMSELQWLNLSFTSVGDRTVEQLSQLQKLENLELAQTKITSHSLTLLAKIASLRSLDLQETFISDRDVEQLAMFTQLTTLKVGSLLSAEAVHALQERLPNCQIVSSIPLAQS
ncbi:serine/threonine-protein kinase [Stieleria varia]|uniref:Serine/threonine-protein kinase PknB n=1 Tax=Stieleria varia TaxID=2528005 RepID=A0A5C6A3L3_9BACT|nr:serine/threonine-protein kinase [Stieleria varia]TWT93965.1 Serine/threonine-protein kinase PknB [Stieleria varia]